MSSTRFVAFSDAARGDSGQAATDAFAAYLLERKRGDRLDPDRIARDLKLDGGRDLIDEMVAVACDPEVRLLEPAHRVRCPACDTASDQDEFLEAEQEEGIGRCPACEEEVPAFDQLPVEEAYTLTDEADAETAKHRAERDTRPRRRAVILCALDVELEQILAALKERGDVEHQVADDGTYYYSVDLAGETTDWTVALALTEAGNSEAAAGAVAAVTELDPDLALYVGVAGGIKDDVQRGDVVVATVVHDYSKGKSTDEGFISRADQDKSSYGLKQAARHVKLTGTWADKIVVAKPDLAEGTPNVHIEPIAAGGHVVAGADSDTAKLIGEVADRAVAVEMEGAGFLGAMTRFPSVQAAVVRGISDRLDDKSASDDEGWQGQASANAAAFAIALLIALAAPVGT